MVTPTNWKVITNKYLYMAQAQSFPLPRVQTDAVNGLDLEIAWKRITLPVIYSVRDISYLLLHNKLPTKERLHRVGLNSDPFCHECPGSPVCNVEHMFCRCLRVKNDWSRVRDLLIDLIGEDIPNLKLINYNWQNPNNENEAVWLLCNYLAKSWITLSSTSHVLNEEEFFGFLRFKYKMDQSGARVSLGDISGL